MFTADQGPFWGRSDHDGRQAEVIEQLRALVVHSQVGEEDAVDATAGGQLTVALVLALLVADDLQHQGVAPL